MFIVLSTAPDLTSIVQEIQFPSNDELRDLSNEQLKQKFMGISGKIYSAIQSYARDVAGEMHNQRLDSLSQSIQEQLRSREGRNSPGEDELSAIKDESDKKIGEFKSQFSAKLNKYYSSLSGDLTTATGKAYDRILTFRTPGSDYIPFHRIPELQSEFRRAMGDMMMAESEKTKSIGRSIDRLRSRFEKELVNSVMSKVSSTQDNRGKADRTLRARLASTVKLPSFQGTAALANAQILSNPEVQPALTSLMSRMGSLGMSGPQESSGLSQSSTIFASTMGAGAVGIVLWRIFRAFNPES